MYLPDQEVTLEPLSLTRVGFRKVGELTIAGRPGTSYELMLEDG